MIEKPQRNLWHPHVVTQRCAHSLQGHYEQDEIGCQAVIPCVNTHLS